MNSEAAEIVKRNSGVQDITYASNFSTDDYDTKKRFSAPVLENTRNSQLDGLKQLDEEMKRRDTLLIGNLPGPLNLDNKMSLNTQYILDHSPTLPLKKVQEMTE